MAQLTTHLRQVFVVVAMLAGVTGGVWRAEARLCSRRGLPTGEVRGQRGQRGHVHMSGGGYRRAGNLLEAEVDHPVDVVVVLRVLGRETALQARGAARTRLRGAQVNRFDLHC